MSIIAPHITRPEDDFRGKYESHNPIMQALQRRFFRALTALIPAGLQGTLEVGCGEGYSTEKLVRAFPGIVWQASDITSALVTLAQQRCPTVRFTVESIYDLQHPDASVDLVLALEVLEHLDRPAEALKELARVTRKWAIISVPHEPLWRIMNVARGTYLKGWGNTPGHINHWTPWGFRHFVQQGFIVRAGKQPVPWTMLLLERKA